MWRSSKWSRACPLRPLARINKIQRNDARGLVDSAGRLVHVGHAKNIERSGIHGARPQKAGRPPQAVRQPVAQHHEGERSDDRCNANRRFLAWVRTVREVDHVLDVIDRPLLTVCKQISRSRSHRETRVCSSVFDGENRSRHPTGETS